VVVERRYIDLDYRSEHSRFYSGTFRRYPSVCHRLHFFSSDIDVADDGDLRSLLRQLEELRDTENYCGYSIMRPLPTSPVGRTMIAPPSALGRGAVCSVTDSVHLFGIEFRITAVPFISQDAQFSRCAHSAMWMVLYHAHLLYRAPRRLPSDIHDVTLGPEALGRHVPSGGLSPAQVMHGLERLALAPIQIALPASRRESRKGERNSLPAVVCRYINSQMPPIVYSDDHAWVMVGYTRSGRGHNRVRLYRHDDARGPYLPVPDPWKERDENYRPWTAAIPPLPQKVYLTGERAELIGREVFDRRLPLSSAAAQRLVRDRKIKWRTYATLATRYKAGLSGRVPAEIADEYRLAQWPRYIWVIEAHDDLLRDTGAPSCLGEVIVDATAHHLEDDEPALAVLAVRVGGEMTLVTPDHDRIRMARTPVPELYDTGCEVAQQVRVQS
jgi:hypothetical protein